MIAPITIHVSIVSIALSLSTPSRTRCLYSSSSSITYTNTRAYRDRYRALHMEGRCSRCSLYRLVTCIDPIQDDRGSMAHTDGKRRREGLDARLERNALVGIWFVAGTRCARAVLRLETLGAM